MQELIIVGAGGLGREVLWLTREINRHHASYSVRGFLDDNPARLGTVVHGVPILGGVEQVSVLAADPGVSFVIAIGEPDIRRTITERLAPFRPHYATLIDPTARGDWERVELAPGVIIFAGVVVTTDVKLGEHTILNPQVYVGHDAVIGNYVTISPNATVSGAVSLGEGVYLGSGSTIRDEVSIGEWTIVGMGAVVTKDLPSNSVATGVPARVVRENNSRRVWM
jgi:sugar O-acyltransferase (sialic acid O-acetyltransferase NeuD family)